MLISITESKEGDRRVVAYKGTRADPGTLVYQDPPAQKKTQGMAWSVDLLVESEAVDPDEWIEIFQEAMGAVDLRRDGLCSGAEKKA